MKVKRFISQVCLVVGVLLFAFSLRVSFAQQDSPYQTYEQAVSKMGVDLLKRKAELMDRFPYDPSLFQSEKVSGVKAAKPPAAKPKPATGSDAGAGAGTTTGVEPDSIWAPRGNDKPQGDGGGSWIGN